MNDRNLQTKQIKKHVSPSLHAYFYLTNYDVCCLNLQTKQIKTHVSPSLLAYFHLTNYDVCCFWYVL